MFEKESIPFAPSLIESMRSIGYSFETAIADLIDNSISANSKKIDIISTPGKNPKLIILDDGCGMNKNEIEEAMRYGSKNPLEDRNDSDLGRFGLGMKAASLSQCRKLTVVSKRENNISAYSWDLDYIVKNGTWSIIGYSRDEIDKFPFIDRLNELEHGTYLLLEEFDRIKESTNNIEETFIKEINNMIEHLALVFHRFIDDNLKIIVNNSEIKGRDPFLLNNKKTQYRREQRIKIDNEYIFVQPYILPHISNMTNEDKKKIGGTETLKNEQGFYIYRNRRLIIWGTWFRLERKDELNKLARVRVDISNKLDYMWSIDIKKSSANLPDKIKKNLYTAIRDSIINSSNVHEYRGRREKLNQDIEYVWERNNLRDGYEYRINRNIPEIIGLESSLDKNQLRLLDKLITEIENNFPVDAFYIDASKGTLKAKISPETKEQYDEVKESVEYLKNNNKNYMKMLRTYMRAEPYCLNNELIKMLKELEREYLEEDNYNGR